MQLIQIDSLQLQASETPLTSGPQMLGATAHLPPIGSRAQESGLGGDDEVVRIWMKRLRDEPFAHRSEEHTSELQSQSNLVCRLLLEKKKNNKKRTEPRET